MKPLKLTMRAFGSYGKETVIDFSKPTQKLFLITGDTGAGKTTIFDAIVFALYGEASSETNKKDGVELQSQFTDEPPFVELRFSEIEGGESRVYTVRREPTYRKKTRKNPISERATLTMPDGTDYLGKLDDVNKKLQEIVGLTKPQFMQVAMIAQGEFMDVLRKDTKNKKAIFSKLFNTGIYQIIVDELLMRKKEKETGINELHAACKEQVSLVSVPDDFPEAEALSAAKARLLSAGALDVTDLETLVDGLKTLCAELKRQSDKAELDAKTRGKARDDARDAYNTAQALVQSYGQLRQAEKTLEDCKKEEGAIRKAEALISEIRDAYEIQAVYQRFEDAAKTLTVTEEEMKKQQERLPGLEETAKKLEKEEQKAQEALDAQNERLTKTSERVNRALELFVHIKQAENEAKKQRQAARHAEEALDNVQKAFKAFETEERENRKTAESIGDVDAQMKLLQAKQTEAEHIAEDLAAMEVAQRELAAQNAAREKAKARYADLNTKWQAKDQEHREKNTALQNARAGILAREELRPGKPCPVCGSLDHPSPCTLSGEAQGLTQEIVDALADEEKTLRKQQQDAAIDAESAGKLAEEKQKNFQALGKQLRKRMEQSVPDLPAEMKLSQAKKALSDWCGTLQEEKQALTQKAAKLKTAQAFLQSADSKKQTLQAEQEKALSQMTAAKEALAAVEAKREGLEAQKEFTAEDEAKRVLENEKQAQQEAENHFKKANKEAQDAKTARDNAIALIDRYEKELPKQRETQEERQIAYRAIMEEKERAESEWQETVAKHPKAETDSLQKDLEAYRAKKAKAEEARRIAEELIDGRPEPDMEKLETAKVQTENDFKNAQELFDLRRETYKTNQKAYAALASKMDERTQVMRDYSVVSGLYDRLAGKNTGARMDIETFVQRYYLKQILDATNARFRDLSAGQFELRMVDDAQAGVGGNHGLDLMVYSTITGKEREVRTLSGGESFMAALSLALGMADRIQENSSTVHLDVMFIDEGFGSLDDHSRGQAVRVLQRVADGERLIGVISHVAELKQAIDDQLLVSKDQDGSHLRWNIG